MNSNNTDLHKTELLAPAGSYEAFEAALGAGADAVYVGGPAFGARAYARNFTVEELIRAIYTAHIHNRKLYLTVNTLLKNRELEEQLYDVLLPVYEAGLDAVIVQDMGVFQFIRRVFPELHLHASTQMTITGPLGMKFLEEQGATRVVAARELSLDELSAMHKTSHIEIEAFIHGALCYSISGQCLMSSMFGGRSGNRGRCAQPCRLSYQAKKSQDSAYSGKALCPLNLKDICTLDILPEIIEAGVTSLKIEGRMKQPEYTAGVTSVYRKYLDLYLQDPDNYQVKENDRKYLLDIFNRGGSCQGYFKQHNGPSMMAFTNEKKSGNVSVTLKSPKTGITGTLLLYPGSPAMLNVVCRDIHRMVSLGEVQYAREHPMTEERIRQQMEKLGNSPFLWDSLDIQMDENIFIPVKLLNELRRSATEQLEEALVAPMQRKAPEKKLYRTSGESSHSGDNSSFLLFASCETEEQFNVLKNIPEIHGLYLPADLMETAISTELFQKKDLYLAFPHVTRGNAPSALRTRYMDWISTGRIKGFLVRNLESFSSLKEAGLARHCVIDASLYTWNNEAVSFWNEQGILRNTMPLELNGKELLHRDNRNSEFIIYGYTPLMLSVQCVRKNLYKCDKQEQSMILKDRYDKEFICKCVCHPWKNQTTDSREYCYNIIYNSIPCGLLKEVSQVRALGAEVLRMNFTTESSRETAKIAREFANVYLKGHPPIQSNFTKGHFKRGAE